MWPDPSGTYVDSTLTRLNLNLSPSLPPEYSWLLFNSEAASGDLWLSKCEKNYPLCAVLVLGLTEDAEKNVQIYL